MAMPGPKPTLDEAGIARLREMAASGMRKREAAEALGITIYMVKNTAHRRGIRFFGKGDQSAGQKRRWGERRGNQPAKPVSPTDVSTDEAVAAFIATNGVTRCPPAFAAASQQGSLPPAEASRRLSKLKLREPQESRGGAQWQRRAAAVANFGAA